MHYFEILSFRLYFVHFGWAHLIDDPTQYFRISLRCIIIVVVGLVDVFALSAQLIRYVGRRLRMHSTSYHKNTLCTHHGIWTVIKGTKESIFCLRKPA